MRITSLYTNKTYVCHRSTHCSDKPRSHICLMNRICVEDREKKKSFQNREKKLALNDEMKVNKMTQGSTRMLMMMTTSNQITAQDVFLSIVSLGK